MAMNLEQRLQNGGSVESKPAEPNVLDQIRQMEGQFAMAMPRGQEASQLVRDALTVMRKTPKLAICDPPSVLGALMTCAQLGLRPGVLGQAWVLPYWDRESGGHRAQLTIGYQGLVELAHRSGKITSLIAHTVYSNDEFFVEYGLDDKLIHRPELKGDRGEPVAYYALARLAGGDHGFWVMSRWEVEQYRDKYATARTKQGKIVGPWAKEFDAMAMKTCVRQLSKWLPKSTEFATAVASDETVRADLSPAAIDNPDYARPVEATPEPGKPVDVPGDNENTTQQEGNR